MYFIILNMYLFLCYVSSVCSDFDFELYFSSGILGNFRCHNFLYYKQRNVNSWKKCTINLYTEHIKLSLDVKMLIKEVLTTWRLNENISPQALLLTLAFWRLRKQKPVCTLYDRGNYSIRALHFAFQLKFTPKLSF